MQEITKKGIVGDIVLPLSALMGLTVIFWMTNLDLWLSSHFFVPGEGWVYRNVHPWRFLYDYGPLPAILLAIGALVVLLLSFWVRKLASYRKAVLFFVLLMLIGPGLVINVIFKDHWGRPRPKYVQEFSGPNPFHQVWQKGVAGNGHSFPSGHASMGFFLMAPYFVLRRTSKKWAYRFLATGICWGLIIGFARVVQGGHFASDVVWAGGFVYFCGLGLAYALRLNHEVLPRHGLRFTINWERVAFECATILVLLHTFTAFCLWASRIAYHRVKDAVSPVIRSLYSSLLHTLRQISLKRDIITPLGKHILCLLISCCKGMEHLLQLIQKKLTQI